MKLSILIPTLTSRKEQFKIISEELSRQIHNKYDNDAIVIYHLDNKEKTVGQKRNELIAKAESDYVVFVDDDDRVAPDYVQTLLEAIESNVDVITFGVDVSINGGKAKPCVYSKDFKEDKNLDTHYERIPNHIMCIKRDIAKVVKFPDINNGEDSAWAKKLHPLLETEYKIDKTLYYYDFNSRTTEAQK